MIWGCPLPGLQVPLLIQQQVLRFQISIDDVPFVEVLEGANHPGGVELGMLLAAVETWLKPPTIYAGDLRHVCNQEISRSLLLGNLKPPFLMLVGPPP